MENFYDNIELYLDQQLSSEDTAAFENALANNTALQKAVAEEKATRATLYAMMVDGFRQRALNDDNAEQSDIQSITEVKQEAKIVAMPQRNSWQRWAIAAALFAAIVTTVIVLNNSQSIDQVALANKYTFDYPVPKVQDAAIDKQLTDQFYSEIKAGKYKEALKTYKQLPAALQKETVVIFFKAFCLLKENEFQAAQKEFETVAASSPDATLKMNIEWYILMAKLGKKEDIKAALEAIANDENHDYQKKAIALLGELE